MSNMFKQKSLMKRNIEEQKDVTDRSVIHIIYYLANGREECFRKYTLSGEKSTNNEII